MNDRTVDDHEWLCALVDGELEGQALAQALEILSRDPAAREAWQSWHLIGDVLRSPELAAATAPTSFCERLTQRLAQEPPPVHASVMPIAPVVQADLVPCGRSANDGYFRWRRVAGAASLVVALGAGWMAAGALWEPASAGLAGTEPGRMIRDARLDELLAAHRQMGGTTALQTPSGFLHNAAFERAAPGR